MHMKRENYVKPDLELIKFRFQGPLCDSTGMTPDFDIDPIDPNDLFTESLDF